MLNSGHIPSDSTVISNQFALCPRPACPPCSRKIHNVLLTHKHNLLGRGTNRKGIVELITNGCIFHCKCHRARKEHASVFVGFLLLSKDGIVFKTLIYIQLL